MRQHPRRACVRSQGASCDEKLSITWWGNIRFEKTFTPELCRLLAARRLRSRQWGARSGLGSIARSHAEGRHGRTGSARDSCVQRRRHHGACLFDVWLPDGDRTGHHRCTRARATAVRGRLHPVGLLASLRCDRALPDRASIRSNTALHCVHHHRSRSRITTSSSTIPSARIMTSWALACARHSITTCTASASRPTYASGSIRARNAADATPGVTCAALRFLPYRPPPYRQT